MTQPSVAPTSLRPARGQGTPSEHRLAWWSTFFHVLAILTGIVGVLSVALAYAFNLGAVSFVGILAAALVSCALMFSLSAMLAGGADVVRLLKLRNGLDYNGDLYL